MSYTTRNTNLIEKIHGTLVPLSHDDGRRGDIFRVDLANQVESV